MKIEQHKSECTSFEMDERIEIRSNQETGSLHTTTYFANVNILLYFPPDLKSFDSKKIFKYLIKTLTWIGQMKWSEPIQSLQAVLFFSPFTKNYCWKSNQPNPISYCHINSGVTTFKFSGHHKIGMCMCMCVS